MTRIPKSQKIHGFIHLRFFILCLQVEQQIANLCFRSINDPVELGLTGGGGPWAHWVQLVISTSLPTKPTWVWGYMSPGDPVGFPGNRQHDPSYRTAFGIQSSLNVWGLQLSRNQDFYGKIGKMLSFVFTKTPFSWPCFLWYDPNHVEFLVSIVSILLKICVLLFATQQSDRKFGGYCDVTFEG